MVRGLDFGHTATDVGPAMSTGALRAPDGRHGKARATGIEEDALTAHSFARYEAKLGLGENRLSTPLKSDLDRIAISRDQGDRKLRPKPAACAWAVLQNKALRKAGV